MIQQSRRLKKYIEKSRLNLPSHSNSYISINFDKHGGSTVGFLLYLFYDSSFMKIHIAVSKTESCIVYEGFYFTPLSC